MSSYHLYACSTAVDAIGDDTLLKLLRDIEAHVLRASHWTASDSPGGNEALIVLVAQEQVGTDAFVAAHEPYERAELNLLELVFKRDDTRMGPGPNGTSPVRFHGGLANLAGPRVKRYASGNAEGAALEFLHDVERNLSGPLENTVDLLRASVEKLTGLIHELRDDRDRLRELLLKAQWNEAALEMQVQRYADILGAWQRFGEAVAKGDPVSHEEASTLAEGVVRTLSTMTAGGIIGNRADAGLLVIRDKAWPELEPFVEALGKILEITGGLTPF